MPGSRAWTCAATSRCASATRGRAPSPSSRSSPSARGCSTSAWARLSLGDTIGVATAGHVRALVAAFGAAGIGPERLALHFHDTYGQALTNVHAGLQAGVTTYDASAGGLGGCPYAKSATGNLATEDLVWFLTGLGIEHGVDLGAVVATSAWMAGEPRPAQPLGGGEGPHAHRFLRLRARHATTGFAADRARSRPIR
ncbi:hypothetical protein [Nocardioides convexus]|uniref:hypothetical protein n=1 Tax=Nocardioides convexus TaxID=2712224 RepID=UPI002418B965|nr:hypothetical protein [Nocardioides convexus]